VKEFAVLSISHWGWCGRNWCREEDLHWCWWALT